MSGELWRLSAVEAVSLLKKKEISPLDLIEASARRIAEVEPAVNALPTLCLDRARDHAKRIMSGAACEASGEAGWLAGLPVSIKDLTDVAGVRTTYGSPFFADHVPAKSHPAGRAHRAQGRRRRRQVQHAGVRRRRQHLQRSLRPHAQSLEHVADLRRLDRRRRGVAGDRRGLAGARLGPWRLAAPARHLLLGGRPAPVARPRDARHLEQSLVAASRCRGRWRATSPTWRCSSTPWRASARTIAMTFDAPAVSFSDGRGQSRCAQARRLHAPTSAAAARSTARSARSAPRWRGASRSWAASSRRRRPTSAPVDEAFLVLRSQQFVVDRELQIAAASRQDQARHHLEHRARPEADASRLAWAERERAAFYRRMVEFFQTYDLLVTPGAPTGGLRRQPARIPTTIDGKKLDNYMARLDVQLGDHRDRQPRHRRALRLRPVRPAGRPAARRQAARRGGFAAGRVALRTAGRPAQAPAHRPQAGNRATLRPIRREETCGS